MLTAREKINVGVEHAYNLTQTAEELSFITLTLACAHFSSVALWTASSLPLLIPLVLVPLGTLKIIHGITNRAEHHTSLKTKVEKEYSLAESLSGVAFLSGIVALPSIATFIGGCIPAFLLLPSLTLPCLGVAMLCLRLIYADYLDIIEMR